MFEQFLVWLEDPFNSKLIRAVLGSLFIGMMVAVLKTTINKYISEPYFRYKSKKVLVYAGYFLAIIYTITIFGENLGNIMVILGVASAGIAFALQEVIISIAGWVAISMGGFYAPGDRVQLGGITGDVIDIGILRTTMMETGQWVEADLYNGRVVKIANSFVFKEPVFNYSALFPFLWDEIKIPIKYGSDYKYARQVLQNIGARVTGEYSANAQASWERIGKHFIIKEAKLEPQVTLAATDNWIELTLRYVVDYRYRRHTKDVLYTTFLEEVEKSEGQIVIASATVQIVDNEVSKAKREKD